MIKHGVTSYLPTTVTAPLSDTLRSLEHLGKAIRGNSTAPGRSRPLGIHLEGPFISHAKRGVHPPENLLLLRRNCYARCMKLQEARFACMTIAPELEGAVQTIS